MQFDITVEAREAVGKGVARTLRRQGKIPGILYGQGECVSLTVDPAAIRKVLHSDSGSNSLLNLSIAKGGTEMKRTAMLKDYQVDPITGALLHTDLFEVAMDKPVRVRVPVAVTGGTPVGVAEGGVLQHNSRELHVECLPGRIPTQITVDPTALKINQGIHVKDVPLAPGITILDDPNMMVVSITAPITDAKLEALLSAAPTGEGAAEPEVIGKGKDEEGADAAVAGAKPGAKAAAPAAAAKDEKKDGKKDAKGEKKK